MDDELTTQAPGAARPPFKAFHMKAPSVVRERLEAGKVAKLEDPTFQSFLNGSLSSVTRRTITSDVWHAKYPSMSKKMFGVNWEEVKPFIIDMFGLEPTTQEDEKLTLFEECAMTLLWMENDIDQAVLAKYFDRDSRQAVSQVLKQWEPRWGEIGLTFCNLPFMDEDMMYRVGVTYIVEGDSKDSISEAARSARVVDVAKQDYDVERLYDSEHMRHWAHGRTNLYRQQ